ncbi:hypothetical protein [uncultured Marixanthomonas sp.]|uniref:hypothetical protein n=1 Tax=uncultured Marixanthomonas sp. TaxID=757245 RepID=UPI0030D80B1B|tara:strand:- start:70263 stop:70805 length:543 start_codon:yes stop_codon:yes gene_type:complete
MSTYLKIKKGISKTIVLPDALQKLCDWIDINGYVGDCFELRADDGETIKHWFGFDDVSHRFGTFGAGPDGSIFSFWVNDEGNQIVVHLGSEGGELHTLTDTFVDFLRLLSIGHDEIGSADMNVAPKVSNCENDKTINSDFRKWVAKEFNVTIPVKGNEIMNVTNSLFNDWMEAQFERYGE